jgi:hypothetical protein
METGTVPEKWTAPCNQTRHRPQQDCACVTCIHPALDASDEPENTASAAEAYRATGTGEVEGSAGPPSAYPPHPADRQNLLNLLPCRDDRIPVRDLADRPAVLVHYEIHH